MNSRITTALLYKINNAQPMSGDGKTAPAVNLLGAFVHEMDALLSNGTLTPAQADPIIELTDQIIELLTAPQ